MLTQFRTALVVFLALALIVMMTGCRDDEPVPDSNLTTAPTAAAPLWEQSVPTEQPAESATQQPVVIATSVVVFDILPKDSATSTAPAGPTAPSPTPSP